MLIHSTVHVLNQSANGLHAYCMAVTVLKMKKHSQNRGEDAALSPAGHSEDMSQAGSQGRIRRDT